MFSDRLGWCRPRCRILIATHLSVRGRVRETWELGWEWDGAGGRGWCVPAWFTVHMFLSPAFTGRLPASIGSGWLASLRGSLQASKGRPGQDRIGSKKRGGLRCVRCRLFRRFALPLTTGAF
ncbi:hypothetical protein BDW68DRAFT_162934 [Aspergillus falconensis]